MMKNSNLHKHLKAERLSDNLIVDHVRPQRFFLIKNQRLRGFPFERVLYDLLVPTLKIFLEAILIVNEEDHIQDAKQCEVTTDLSKAVNNCGGSDSCLLEGIVVVGILEKDSHLMVLFKIWKIFYKVRLVEGEIHISLAFTPRPKVFQFIFEERRDLSFVEVPERKF
jgi:hypothetical protein